MTFAPRKAVKNLLAWNERRRRRSRERHGLVLMYHRVAHAAADPWDLCVWPENFARQIAALREIADVVPVRDIHLELQNGRHDKPLVAITFDDGYADNLYAAKPVLEAHRVPATVFLATGSLDDPSPYWWDGLAHALLAVDGLPSPLILESGADRFECHDRAISLSGRRGQQARRALHDRLWHWLGHQPSEARPVLIGRLQAWAGRPTERDDSARPMTRTEVKELVAGGLVDAGAHTHHHPMLSRLTTARKHEEIEGCWHECRAILGQYPVTFAYPHGDFDQECVDLVRATGFKVACTSQPALVWPDTESLTTPRVAVRNWDERAFRNRLRWWLA